MPFGEMAWRCGEGISSYGAAVRTMRSHVSSIVTLSRPSVARGMEAAYYAQISDCTSDSSVRSPEEALCCHIHCQSFRLWYFTSTASPVPLVCAGAGCTASGDRTGSSAGRESKSRGVSAETPL